MRRGALAVLLAVLVMPASAAAETKTFTGPGTGNPGDWNNPAQWTPAGVPGPGDDVIFAAGGVLDGAAATVRSLVVNANVQLVVRHNGGVLTVTGGAGAPGSSNAGTLFVGSGGTFTLQAAAELTQGGQLAVGSSSPSGSGATLNNAGTWTLTTGATGVNFGEGTIAFNNSGALVGEGAGDKQLVAPLVNTGTVSAEEGTLVAAAGVSGAGDYTIADGATLTLFGTIPDGGSVAGAGTARLGGLSVAQGASFTPATLQVVGGTNDLDGDIDVTTLLGDGGIRTGDGTLNVGSGPSRLAGMSFQGTGGAGPTTFPAGVNLPVTGGLSVLNDAVVNLNGITTWSGGTLATGQNNGTASGSTINNAGIFRIEGDGLNTFTAAGGVFHNLPGGQIVREVGTGTSTFGAGIVDNDGSLTVASGILNVFVTVNSSGPITVAGGATMDGFATTTLEAGGSLTGAGTVAMNLVNQAGTVRPGSSPGLLTIDGDYTQGAAGTLQSEIAGTTPGTELDQLAVTGNVTLDGTLAIQNDPGFDPALTDIFEVVSAGGTLLGTFATLTGAQVNGKTYSPSYAAGPPGSATLGIQQSAPVNTAPPSLPGSAQVGDTVTCDPGTWTGSPSFAFQWLRDGSQVAGATAASYTVVGADAGRNIVCRVTATNGGGSTDADSGSLVPTAPPSPPPPPSPPANSAPPSVPASGEVGQRVICNPGVWTGEPTFTFRWLRNGVEVAGATAAGYRLRAADAGATIVCRVTATNGAGSVSVDSGPFVPTARTETIRGDAAFTEGTANDLYLACTRLDLWLIDVLPRGRRRIHVSGAADLRLVGRTVEIFIGQRAPGKRVGRARVQPDGSFETTIGAPRGARARKAARYQARTRGARSQRLRLVRRMVATTLSRTSDELELSGVLLRPFTSPPAVIEIERYLSCRRREKVGVVAVRPNRRGRFTVPIPLPDGPPAVLYRARTRAPTTTTGRVANVFTLPRALDLP